MAKRDYYEVLGVNKNAGADEIKKAFRNHARHLHPDNKVSGDEAAFKELAEAYEVLTDNQRRSLYDRYGHEGLKGTGFSFDNVDFSSFAGFGMDDLIDVFFGGGLRSAGRPGGAQVGAHLKYDLEMDFLEAVFGAEKKISIRRLEDCTVCSGSGAAPGSNRVTCTTCGGAGHVQQIINSWFGQSVRVMECPECQGAGQRIEKPCNDCKGEGLSRKAREFEIKVPAGIESGSRIRVSAAGDKGRRGGPFGDLFVVIHVEEHKYFIRDGQTIHVNQPVSFSMAALGGKLLVETVDGPKSIKVTAGTQMGATVTLKGSGVPRLGNPTRRGDQIVHLIIQTPTKLTSEERNLLERLAELRGESLTGAADDLQLSGGKKENRLPEKPSDIFDDTVKQSNRSSNNGSESGDHKEDSEDKDDPSLFDKIIEAFKPKNGEQDNK